MKRIIGQEGRGWFKAGVASGFVLAIVSVAVAVASYYFVAGHLAIDHLNREAGRYAATLEYRAQEGATTAAELAALLESLRGEEQERIAWLRVLDRGGRVLAESGEVPLEVFDDQVLRQVLELRRRNVVEEVVTSDGKVLVAVLPFRFQLPEDVATQRPGPAAGRERRFQLVEVALYLRGARDAFVPLQRNLLVGIAAPVALLASLMFLALRFPAYLRGRELEQQLEVAHRVQKELLPAGPQDAGILELATEFRPFWGVGGDYFDVFTEGKSQTFIALGDVSGKGLPAALIMGLLHGAVRSAARLWDGSNHNQLAVELNRLLYEKTEENRFVTFFWACYDTDERRLRYINAGHNPPFVVRRLPGAAPEVERLTTGGPVLGLLPAATYDKGDTRLEPGDLLVLFSDGVIEATDSAGREFGAERVEQLVCEHSELDPEAIREQILERLETFMGGALFDDDMTLLIVRVPRKTPDEENL